MDCLNQWCRLGNCGSIRPDATPAGRAAARRSCGGLVGVSRHRHSASPDAGRGVDAAARPPAAVTLPFLRGPGAPGTSCHTLWENISFFFSVHQNTTGRRPSGLSRCHGMRRRDAFVSGASKALASLRRGPTRLAVLSRQPSPVGVAARRLRSLTRSTARRHTSLERITRSWTAAGNESVPRTGVPSILSATRERLHERNHSKQLIP